MNALLVAIFIIVVGGALIVAACTVLFSYACSLILRTCLFCQRGFQTKTTDEVSRQNEEFSSYFVPTSPPPDPQFTVFHPQNNASENNETGGGPPNYETLSLFPINQRLTNLPSYEEALSRMK